MLIPISILDPKSIPILPTISLVTKKALQPINLGANKPPKGAKSIETKKRLWRQKANKAGRHKTTKAMGTNWNALWLNSKKDKH